jgi:hypothetical protein
MTIVGATYSFSAIHGKTITAEADTGQPISFGEISCDP